MKNFLKIAAIIISGLCWYFSIDLSGNYWYLLWIAPIPVLFFSFQSSAWQSFLIAFIAYLIGRLSWLPYLLTVLPVPLAIFFTVFFPLIFALIVVLTRKIVLIKQNGWSAFAFPVLWSLFEFLLIKFSPDGTAGSLAYTQSNFLPVVQLASVTGILGITFLVTIFPSALAVYYHSKKWTRSLSITFSLLFISILFGVIRMNRKSSVKNDITVGLASLDEKFHSETNHPNAKEEMRTANLYADEVAVLSKQGAQVAVLPEKIVNVTANPGDSIKNIFINAATNNQITVIAGYTQLINDSLKQNKAFVITPAGKLLSDYQKVNLFEGEIRNAFVPGKEIATFNLNDITSGLAICKDLDYQAFIRSYDKNKIQVLYVPAWDFIKDGWLHSRMAVLRGVENGYAIIRTARQGELTVSDYLGRVLYEASTTNNKAAAFTATFPLRTTKTIYNRFGDWFGFIIVIASVYFILFAISRKRRINL